MAEQLAEVTVDMPVGRLEAVGFPGPPEQLQLPDSFDVAPPSGVPIDFADVLSVPAGRLEKGLAGDPGCRSIGRRTAFEDRLHVLDRLGRQPASSRLPINRVRSTGPAERARSAGAVFSSSPNRGQHSPQPADALRTRRPVAAPDVADGFATRRPPSSITGCGNCWQNR